MLFTSHLATLAELYEAFIALQPLINQLRTGLAPANIQGFQE
ncbi:hypothetical protein [Pelistega europaea]|nr:hypothetical protein [Pelistega europaea]